MGLKQNLHTLKEKYKGTKMAPAFNAIHTFLYLPNETTHNGTHVKAADDLKRTMNMVILSLVPCLLFGIFNSGYQYNVQTGDVSQALGFFSTEFWNFANFSIGAWKVLPLVVISYGVGLGVEFIFAIIKGHEVEEGYLVTGMLVPLIVPVDIPLWMLSIAVIFGVVIGKEVFGGTGMNILNPALVARAFAFFSYAPSMSGDKVWVADASTVDAISGETILGSLAAGKEAGYSVLDMFLGYIPGSVGETSVLMILIGAAFLLFTGIASWRIMLSATLGAAIMGLIFNALGINALMNFPWWQHLLVGGFAFGVVFMATDPVSAAQTDKGKWIYGLLIGVLAIMIRVFNGAYPEGMMMAILLMNVFAPTIDHYVVEGNIKRRKKRLKNNLETA
jgi:Na+-transporting NADH:ubiquinone oxidoreductase subunit B